jgi:hypothetical protein
LASRPDFQSKICATGQHRELLAQVLALFELVPDWNLEIMRPDQDLAYLTGAALSGVGEIFQVLPARSRHRAGRHDHYFCRGISCLYHRIPVAHIEAGLRTDNIYAPWPEEVNRRLVSHIADLHFAPTARARDNFCKRGSGGAVTGNTGIDALVWVSDQLDRRAELRLRADATSSPRAPAHSKGILRWNFLGKTHPHGRGWPGLVLIPWAFSPRTLTWGRPGSIARWTPAFGRVTRWDLTTADTGNRSDARCAQSYLRTTIRHEAGHERLEGRPHHMNESMH